MHFQHLICIGVVLVPLAATGLLAFEVSTYGFVPDLLKFLFAEKLLFCFLYGGGLNPGLRLLDYIIDLSLFLFMFSYLSCPCS